MDKWLGSGAKLLDNLVQAPADEPQVSVDGRKELKFGQGQLGFDLECMHVVNVNKESQAARRGVEVGDRLTSVDGRAVPEFELDDHEGEQRAHELVMKWLDDMPRPAVLTFESAPAHEGNSGAPLGDDPDALGAPPGKASEEGAINIDPDAQRDRITEQPYEALPFALSHAQHEEQRSDEELLKRERTVTVHATDELREQQRKVASLWKQLAVLKAENKQILLVQSRVQEEASDAMEVAQKREQALKDDVAQLRQALDAANRAAADGAARSAAAAEASTGELQATVQRLAKEGKESAAKAAAAESQAAAAEAEMETLRRELAGFHAEHETELRLLREKQDRWEKDALERFEAQARTHAEREAESARLLAEARSEASGADLDLEEAEAPSDIPKRADSDTKETGALYDRIALLQKRCALLQRKLSAVSAQGPSVGMDLAAPSWAPRFVAIVGIRFGQPLLLFYTGLRAALLRITHWLMQHEFWLWVFYAHIAVLYTIAASWYAQSVTDPASPIDALNAGIGKATSADGRSKKG